MAPWKTFVGWIKRKSTLGARGPYITSTTHALITVLGLMPYPVGALGMLLYFTTGNPWLWLVASTWTCGWYWRRELRQHDGRIPWRLDPVLDVAMPTLSLAAQWPVLLLVAFGGL